jgi:pyrroloquinoline quinone (PQQ) biosynthesis protein C
MYLEAMESLGANPKEMYRIIEQLRSGKNIEFILENNSIPQHIKEFMSFTFEVVKTDQPHIIAAVFTFGREDLIPDMFIEIIKNLKKSNKENLEDLIYYFERHIEVDADEHGPLALEMIQQLCGNDTSKWDEALDYSKKALELRIGLWDGILNEIQKQNKLNFVA